MAVLDRIKFDGLTSREWLVYRYPGEDFVLGSALIVGEGQVAVFIKGGKICDVFYPGSYTLNTDNLPLLNKIVNLPYGRKTPFTAEIYYINTTTKLDMHWGTTDPIQLIDPKYFVRLHIRAFGQFGLKIVDYTSFISELIGALGNSAVNYKKVLEFYKGVLVTKVKTIVSDLIINEKISAFEITPKLDEISQKAHKILKVEFEKYGFELPNFYIQSINFPDEDFDQINKILEKKASFEIIGDNRYATMRSFDVYEGAAKNENGVAGAFMAGGMGIGMGAGMASGVKAEASPGSAVIYCPNCHGRNEAGQRFCSSCGESLGAKKRKCYKCGAEIPENSQFCNNCGASLKKRACECGQELEPGVKFCPNCGKNTEEL